MPSATAAEMPSPTMAPATTMANVNRQIRRSTRRARLGDHRPQLAHECVEVARGGDCHAVDVARQPLAIAPRRCHQLVDLMGQPVDLAGQSIDVVLGRDIGPIDRLQKIHERVPRLARNATPWSPSRPPHRHHHCRSPLADTRAPRHDTRHAGVLLPHHGATAGGSTPQVNGRRTRPARKAVRLDSQFRRGATYTAGIAFTGAGFRALDPRAAVPSVR